MTQLLVLRVQRRGKGRYEPFSAPFYCIFGTFRSIRSGHLCLSASACLSRCVSLPSIHTGYSCTPRSPSRRLRVSKNAFHFQSCGLISPHCKIHLARRTALRRQGGGMGRPRAMPKRSAWDRLPPPSSLRVPPPPRARGAGRVRRARPCTASEANGPQWPTFATLSSDGMVLKCGVLDAVHSYVWH